MKKIILIAILLLVARPLCQSEPLQGCLPYIPPGALPDPHGKFYRTDGRLSRPILGIFTTPNYSQGDAQRKWVEILDGEGSSPAPSNFGLYLIEDMDATAFRSLARKQLQRKYKTGGRPVVLLDEDGSMRKRFGIPKGETVVLIYDKTNQLRLSEKGPPNDAAVARVQKVIKQISAKN
jgi:hypothetical protein